MSATHTPVSPAERRASPRFQPAFGTVYRLGPGNGHGLVWDISATGVSMLVSDLQDPGTIVRGELATEFGDRALPVAIMVVHARSTNTGDYLLGARFDRVLGPDELGPFVTPPAAPKAAAEAP